MPTRQTKARTQTSKNGGEPINFYISDNYSVPAFRMVIELNQICGYQNFFETKYLPVAVNCRYPSDIFVTPHEGASGNYRLVNHQNDSLTDFLSSIGPYSSIEVLLLEDHTISTELDFLLNEFVPKMSSSQKISDVLKSIAIAPNLILAIKRAYKCSAKTKDGVPVIALRRAFGGNSPTVSTISKIINEAQRAKKWDESAISLGLPEYETVVRDLSKDKEVLERFLFELDEVAEGSNELAELCCSLYSFLCDAGLNTSIEGAE